MVIIGTLFLFNLKRLLFFFPYSLTLNHAYSLSRGIHPIQVNFTIHNVLICSHNEVTLWLT